MRMKLVTAGLVLGLLALPGASAAAETEADTAITAEMEADTAIAAETEADPGTRRITFAPVISSSADNA